MDDIKEQIRQIKYLRMKPEERFLTDIFEDVKIVRDNSRLKIIYYKLDGKTIFEQDDRENIFLVDYDKIWEIMTHKYDSTPTEIRKLIRIFMLRWYDITIGEIITLQGIPLN